MDIYVDVYEPDTERRLLLTAPDGILTTNDRVRIGRLGIVTAGGMPALEGQVIDADFMLGDSLHVTGFSLPSEAAANDKLSIGIRIEAMRQIYEDYIFFFHLFDINGVAVAQTDSPILTGDWTTAALIPDVPLGVRRMIDLPEDLPEGRYRLVMGMYSYASQERLPVYDGQGNLLPDGLIEMGWIKIR